MSIYKALLKYDYANFTLDILEYCSRELLIEREKLFIDNLKPEYNILKIAGSNFGFNHNEASKELMSSLAKGRVFSTETLLKMRGKIRTRELK